MSNSDWVAHIDMDAFYASVEQRDFPKWRGKPLVVAYPGPRSVVAAASYAARSFGVRSAMPLASALRRCPDLIVAPPRMSLYSEISQALRLIYGSFTQRIEPLALDECYLGLDTLVPGKLVAEIRRRIRQQLDLPASAGIGPNKLVAKIGSGMAKPDGQKLIRPEQVLEFLWPLAIEKLWGVGPVTAEKLHQRGWHSIGDIAQADQDELCRIVGEKIGRDMWQLAWGKDERPLDGHQLAKSLSVEATFERDRGDLSQLLQELESQAQRLERRLRREGCEAGAVVLKLRWPDWKTESRTFRLSSPSLQWFHLVAAAGDYLSQNLAGRSLRLLGLGAIDLHYPHQPKQLQLFE